jgi:hypothetical protein
MKPAMSTQTSEDDWFEFDEDLAERTSKRINEKREFYDALAGE